MSLEEISRQVSYVEGLMDGLSLPDGSKEGRVLQGMVQTLHAVRDSIKELREEQEELKEYLETLDEDLNDIEEDLYGDYFDDDFVEVKCSNCGEKVYFPEEVMKGDARVEVSCPNCKEVVYRSETSGQLTEISPVMVKGQRKMENDEDI